MIRTRRRWWNWRSRATSALATFAVFVAPAHAQLSGRIVDEDQRPIGQAVIVLWRGTREVSRAPVTEQGVFTLSPAQVSEADALVARAIGYRASTFAIGQLSDRSLRIQLSRLPSFLTPVTVSSSIIECDQPDDANARRVWERMSQRYLPEPKGTGLLAQIRSRTGLTIADDIGVIDEENLPTFGGWFLDSSLVNNAISNVDDENVYARSRRKGAPSEYFGQQYDAWYYANFHHVYQSHFIAPAFARRHRLLLAVLPDGGMRIGFCGRDRKKPYLRGTLSLTSDTALTVAEWEFVTPPPREFARGFVEYVRHPGSAARVALIPSRSLFWRRAAVGGGLYWQDARVYSSWLRRDYPPEPSR